MHPLLEINQTVVFILPNFKSFKTPGKSILLLMFLLGISRGISKFLPHEEQAFGLVIIPCSYVFYITNAPALD